MGVGHRPRRQPILAHHWPDVPNLGDLKTVDWAAVEPVDIFCGGYPCQPFSNAGLRKGTDDERHIWPWIARALGVLRPRVAVFENVAGHLRLGFDTVLADLARIGFDAEWCVVRADEVAPPSVAAPHPPRPECRRREPGTGRGLGTPTTCRARCPCCRHREPRTRTGRDCTGTGAWTCAPPCPCCPPRWRRTGSGPRIVSRVWPAERVEAINRAATGASTAPPSPAGSTPPDDEPHGQLTIAIG
ncbi:DNA cytosine methyltransferase [Streptomyces microflavus]|uniref:DNA cytosine methyltransferase n=1 Tax=Streptomyces microflavus TaxID=1919 RepID=UPI003B227876